LADPSSIRSVTTRPLSAANLLFSLTPLHPLYQDIQDQLHPKNLKQSAQTSPHKPVCKMRGQFKVVYDVLRTRPGYVAVAMQSTYRWLIVYQILACNQTEHAIASSKQYFKAVLLRPSQPRRAPILQNRFHPRPRNPGPRRRRNLGMSKRQRKRKLDGDTGLEKSRKVRMLLGLDRSFPPLFYQLDEAFGVEVCRGCF